MAKQSYTEKWGIPTQEVEKASSSNPGNQSYIEKWGIVPEDHEDDVIAENEKERIAAGGKPTASGMPTPKKKPFNIVDYITDSAMNAPVDVAQSLINLPSEAAGIAKHPIRSGYNLAIGATEGVRGLLNLPGMLGRAAAKHGLISPEHARAIDYEIPDPELARRMHMDNQMPGDALSRGIGEFLVPGGVGKKALGAGLKGLAGSSALSAASQGQNPLEAAFAALLPAGAGKLGGKAVNAVRPTSLFPSNLNPEQLRQALRITQGTDTHLGSVIENPTLSKLYENVLANTPGSNAENKMIDVAGKIKDRGTDLFGIMGGENTPENFGHALQGALKSAHEEVKGVKDFNYGQVEKEAEKSGVKVGRKNTSNMARKILGNVRESAELEHSFDPKLMSTLKLLANPENENSLKLTNIYRSKLGSLANEAYRDGKDYEYGIIKGLRNALDDDIGKAIGGSGNTKLKESYKNAQEHYKTEYAPYKDKDISKFIREGGDPDMLLSTFLKSSKTNDRSTLLNKLMTKLKPEDRGLPGLAYYQQAIEEGSLNPLKLRTLHNKLGKRQQEALIPDEAIRKQLNDYIKLVGKNTEGLSLMVNNKTGQRNQFLLGGLTSALGTTAAGLPGGMLSLAAPAALGRLATKGLTSEKARDMFVKALIKQKEGAPAPSVAGKLTKKLANSKNLGKLAAMESVEDQRRRNEE